MFAAEFLMTWALMTPTGLCAEQQPADPEKTAANAIQKSLGVEFAILESKFRRSITSTKTPFGFKIRKVENGSVASKAGWNDGDVLLEWNEKPIKTVAEVDQVIQAAKSGDAVKYKLARFKKDEPITSRQPWEYITGQVVLK